MKNILTKLKTLAVAGITAAATGLATLPAQAETLKNVKYIDANGVEQTCPEATLVTKDTETITGWYVVTGTVERAGITVSSAAHLILADGAKLTVKGASAKAGITVSGDGNSLAIYGQSAGSGELTATGNAGGAGIGGNDSNPGQNITINGGIVIAKGGSFAAGIGGGIDGAASNITINGGSVTATGSSASSAGIGCGSLDRLTHLSVSDIYVNPILALRAGTSENPKTEIATDRTKAQDVASALAGQQYATAAIDYGILLRDGEAFKVDGSSKVKINTLLAENGLTYADKVWTMSNFVFRTSYDSAVQIGGNDAVTFTVLGDNTLVCGDSSDVGAIGLMIAPDVKFQGSGSLTVTTGNGTGNRAGAIAIYADGSIEVEDITLTTNAGNSESGSYGCVSVGSDATFTVNNATVFLNGGSAPTSCGLAGGLIEGFLSVAVNGTGKLTAAAGAASAEGGAKGVWLAYAQAGVEPEATAKDASGNELTWDSAAATYKKAGVVAPTVVLTAPLPNYRITLKDGQAYTNSVKDANKFTEGAKAMGLSYDAQTGVWTMKNFNFTTTANTGMVLEDANTTITVSGTCSIATTATSTPSAVKTHGNITINGAASGVNTLTITIPGKEEPNADCTGIFYEEDSDNLCIGDNVTVTVAAGRNTRAVCGPKYLSVSGSGKLIAQTGGGDEMYAISGQEEPDAAAMNNVDGSTPVWIWVVQEKDYQAGTYANISGSVTNIATNVTLTAKAPAVQIPSKPAEIENATLAVYTNGVLSADGTVWSNGVATVVYTANAGYYFADGATVVTNALDTSVNPAVNKDEPSSPTINYTLVLANGKVRKNSASGADITATVAGMGLSYSDGAWTMNGFNFTTTATCAMKIQGSEETTIVVSGENSLTGGAGKGDVMALLTSVKTNLRGDGSLTITAGAATEMYKSNYGVYVESNVSIQGITLTANGGDRNGGYSNGMLVYYGSGCLTVTAGAKVSANGPDYGLQCGGTVIVEGTGSIKGTSSDKGIGGYTQPQAVAKDESGNELAWSNYAYTDAAGDAAKTVILTGPTPSVMLGKIAQRYPWNGMLDIQYKTLHLGAGGVVTFFADGKVIGTAPGTGGKSATASFDLNTVADGAFKEKALKGVQITATIE